MKELQLPIVVVHLVPLLSKYGMRETIVEAHAEHLLAWKSTFTCHGLHDVEDTEEDSKVADIGPKEQLYLLAYSSSCEPHQPPARSPVQQAGPQTQSSVCAPGILAVHTGFWFGDEANSLVPPISTKLQAWLKTREKPVCVNFGSMDIFESAPWAKGLLAALMACGRRILSIGKSVPIEVGEWPDSM